MALPIKIKQWLNNRGITDAIIATNNLDWNGNQIVIPIFDPAGNFLFNKYRRNPFSEEGPKYKYEKGTTAQLFNSHKIPNTKFIVICEGEMDAMRLEAENIIGATSTGGAGTFKDEWLTLLAGKDIYVCYDNDDAGMKGAVKLLTKLPAKLILIPRNKGVKDITDFLQKPGRTFTELLITAESYPILCEPVPKFKFIKDVITQIKKYNYHLERLLVQERNAKNTGKPYAHLDYIRQLLLNAIDNLHHEIRKMRYFNKPVDIEGNKNRITNEDVIRAKEVPIENFIKVNRLGFAHCPFGHTDKTPSLRIYRNQNRWHCFSCSLGSDVIDFYMKQNNCDFITAVKKLINK